MLEAILLTITPVLTSYVVDLFKKVPTFNSLVSSNRPAFLRLLAYALSLFFVLLQGWMTGALDNANLNTAISALLESFIFFLGSLGVYQMRSTVQNQGTGIIQDTVQQ